MPDAISITPPDPFHSGEREAQQRVGVRARMAAQGAPIRNYMPDQHRQFFADLPFLLAATTDRRGWPIGTVLEGPPGFVSTPDAASIHIDARPQPAFDPAASSLVPGAGVGLLGIDLATRRRNRANGRIVRAGPGGLDVAVEQSFGNCAQYIQRRELTAGAMPVATAAAPPEALSALDAEAERLIAAADTFFVASAAGAAVDMSHRGGRPGFVRTDGNVLTIPDFSGNRYFNTLGNFLLSSRAGLLFIDFDRGDLLHLAGDVEIVWDSDEARHFARAERLWRVRLSHAWRRRGALALRWAYRDAAPTTQRTGTWDALGEADVRRDR